MIAQHDLLKEVATLVDAGRIVTTMTEHGGILTPASLAQAHRDLEAGKMIGKRAFDTAW
jgi:hypothetical protein